MGYIILHVNRPFVNAIDRTRRICNRNLVLNAILTFLNSIYRARLSKQNPQLSIIVLNFAIKALVRAKGLNITNVS